MQPTFKNLNDAELSVAPLVVAVIPAYNEERFIASVVLKTRPHVSQVIVIDDGSTDHTAALAQAAGAHVVRQTENAGKAAALRVGFQTALEQGAHVLVCLDADAQHDAGEIPAVIKPILDDRADVVIGSRFLETKSKIPAWRKVGQHALTVMTNGLSGVKVSDSQSGFRAFSAEVARSLNLASRGLGVESEMQFRFEDGDLRIAEVPISVSYLDGNKRNPVVHGLEVVDVMLSLVARRRPLLFIAMPGLLLSLSGVAAGFQVVNTMQRSGELMIGLTILTALLVLGGMLLGVTGIMLHSLSHFTARISEEIRSLLSADRVA